MEYSFIKQNIKEENINENIQSYMNVWSDFLKILVIKLTSISNTNYENDNELWKYFSEKKSELNNKAIFILFSSNKEKNIKNINEIENYLIKHWSIYGEEFIKVI